MNKSDAAKKNYYGVKEIALFSIITLAALALGICAGSVNVSIKDVALVLFTNAENPYRNIIASIRIPRVLCAALTGAALSLCGAAMQGLLRNPLADGSTLGVSSGAALGAIAAMAFGFTKNSGIIIASIVCAAVSLTFILSLSYKMDHSLSTNTIILIGVVFTMFSNSLISLIISFSGEKVKSITFWMMGSLSGKSYANVLTLAAILIVFGAAILWRAEELNAFAIGEDNARNVGVNVKRVKLILLICVSALVGACVSLGGTIGFVGLVIPHGARFIAGPNHKKLLPASAFAGAFFLTLADLAGRVLIRPLEIPIGVITSLIGSVVFVHIFYFSRKR
jgi:iron complex transport system permease protein